MPEDKKMPADIGAIWVMKSKKGTEYLSMSITIDGVKKQFVAFKNHKEKDIHPDFRIFPSNPRGSGGYSSNQTNTDFPF